MAPGQRGRVWPIFTGERGHYELARALQSGGAADLTAIRQTYVRGMERFANDGLLLSEQVWDGVGVKPEGYETGAGTDSATPSPGPTPNTSSCCVRWPTRPSGTATHRSPTATASKHEDGSSESD